MPPIAVMLYARNPVYLAQLQALIQQPAVVAHCIASTEYRIPECSELPSCCHVVAVIGMRLPIEDELRFIGRLRTYRSEIAIVALPAFEFDEYDAAILAAGADVIVNPDDIGAALIDAIGNVANAKLPT